MLPEGNPSAFEAGLVSIITPTFNRAYCLPATLDSVLAQTYSHWELMLIDDGSTDNTAELIASRYAHDPRIRYIAQPNGGVSNARNTGLSASRGEFIAFLDSDDRWFPWKLEVQLAALSRFPEAGFLWTDMEAINPSGEQLSPRYLRTMYSAYRHFKHTDLFTDSVPIGQLTPAAPDPSAKLWFGDIFPAMILGNLVHTSTVLLRRERLARVGRFDETIKISGEDYDFHFRSAAFGPVAFLDLPSIRYQKGMPDSLCSNSGATAANFLKTVERAALEDSTGAHRFSAAHVQLALASAHRWLAEVRFAERRRHRARKHAIKSLGGHFLQPRLWFIGALSFIPTRFLDLLRKKPSAPPAPPAEEHRSHRRRRRSSAVENPTEHRHRRRSHDLSSRDTR